MNTSFAYYISDCSTAPKELTTRRLKKLAFLKVEIKFKIEDFALKCPVNFIFNLESDFCLWRLVVLAVENTAKYHS